MSREQDRRESILDYFHDKAWLCSKLNLSVEETRDEIAAAVWSREAASHSLVQKFESTDQILQELLHFELVDSHCRHRIAASKVEAGTSGRSQSSGYLSSDRRRQSSKSLKRSEPSVSSASNQGKVERKCYRCGLRTHIIRDCPKPNLIAQIDLGDSVCTKRASSVLNENFEIIPLKSKLGGFESSEVCSLGVVKEKVVLSNLVPKMVEFTVVPDTAQDYEVILGRPFTETPDISYTRTGNELIFSNVDEDIFENINKLSKVRSSEEK